MEIYKSRIKTKWGEKETKLVKSRLFHDKIPYASVICRKFYILVISPSHKSEGSNSAPLRMEGRLRVLRGAPVHDWRVLMLRDAGSSSLRIPYLNCYLRSLQNANKYQTPMIVVDGTPVASSF